MKKLLDLKIINSIYNYEIYFKNINELNAYESLILLKVIFNNKLNLKKYKTILNDFEIGEYILRIEYSKNISKEKILNILKDELKV